MATEAWPHLAIRTTGPHLLGGTVSDKVKLVKGEKAPILTREYTVETLATVEAQQLQSGRWIAIVQAYTPKVKRIRSFSAMGDTQKAAETGALILAGYSHPQLRR